MESARNCTPGGTCAKIPLWSARRNADYPYVSSSRVLHGHLRSLRPGVRVSAVQLLLDVALFPVPAQEPPNTKDRDGMHHEDDAPSDERPDEPDDAVVLLERGKIQNGQGHVGHQIHDRVCVQPLDLLNPVPRSLILLELRHDSASCEHPGVILLG